jgi:hypothetical protein
MKIKLSVFNDRKIAGTLSFQDRNGTNREFHVSAKAHPDISGVKDPAEGTYQMVKIVQTDTNHPGVLEAYGHTIVFFEHAESGEILAIHAGQPDDEKEMVPTEGGIGLSEKDFKILLAEIKIAEAKDVSLEIVQKRPLIFGGITRPKINTSRPVTRVQVAPKTVVLHEHHDHYIYGGAGQDVVGDVVDFFYYRWLYQQSNGGIGEDSQQEVQPQMSEVVEDQSQVQIDPNSTPLDDSVQSVGSIEEGRPVIVDPFADELKPSVDDPPSGACESLPEEPTSGTDYNTNDADMAPGSSGPDGEDSSTSY